MATKFTPNFMKAFPALIRQKLQIERDYAFILCKLKCDTLTCIGDFQPSISCDTYRVRITYNVGKAPKVKILNPLICYHDDIHLYKIGDLCLYYPKDFIWDCKRDMIAQIIIPWISEWIIFYEIWKLTGKWEGKEVKHKVIQN